MFLAITKMIIMVERLVVITIMKIIIVIIKVIIKHYYFIEIMLKDFAKFIVVNCCYIIKEAIYNVIVIN